MARAPQLGSLATRLGSALDGAILRALRRGSDARAPRPGDEDRRAHLVEVTRFYDRLGDALFAPPPAPSVTSERRRRLPNGGEVLDLAWPSGYQPHHPEIRDAYLRAEANQRACARLFKHAGPPRNAIVLIHGYRAGQFFVEERAYPVRWLYRLGLDVALFTLPFHALRSGGVPPTWPSVNPARTNEGFGQAIFDLRSLVKYLAPPSLAISGMSLGGYTTALYATVESPAFAGPMIPVASFPDLFWQHGEGQPERARAEREGITLDMLRAAMAIHTPLSRRPLVAPERMLVVAAEGDRIAPPSHATRLARHFDCEELRFAGGHLLQLGRGDAFRALARKLAEHGLIERR
jgi:predicted alpha/beta-hydrolase family hydrolase